jgi:transcriptional regulator with XRE-family HTH domain
MKTNQLTGSCAKQAREHIGLSLLSASKIVGINRNQLSQFEKEKLVISAEEKKALITVYSERGYSFEDELEHHSKDELKEFDSELIIDHYDKTDDVLDNIESRFGSELSELLGDFLDSHNQLIKQLEIALTGKEKTEVVSPEFTALETELIAHFKADKEGQVTVSNGLFGENKSARCEKFTGLLALQYMRSLNVKHPNLIDLSLSKSKSGSDNYRVLDFIDDSLRHEELGEFSHCTNELVQ